MASTAALARLPAFHPKTLLVRMRRQRMRAEQAHSDSPPEQRNTFMTTTRVEVTPPWQKAGRRSKLAQPPTSPHRIFPLSLLTATCGPRHTDWGATHLVASAPHPRHGTSAVLRALTAGSAPSHCVPSTTTVGSCWRLKYNKFRSIHLSPHSVAARSPSPRALAPMLSRSATAVRGRPRS